MALILAENGKILFESIGNNLEDLHPVTWDASNHIGKTMCIRVVDYDTCTLAHINVDDFQVYNQQTSTKSV